MLPYRFIFILNLIFITSIQKVHGQGSYDSFVKKLDPEQVQLFQETLKSCESKKTTKDKALVINQYKLKLDEVVYELPKAQSAKPNKKVKTDLKNEIKKEETEEIYFYFVLRPVLKFSASIEGEKSLSECNRVRDEIIYIDHGTGPEEAELLPESKMSMQLLDCLCKTGN